MPAAPGSLVIDDNRQGAQDGAALELGVRAQLIESPNLDRFLRRAQEFLDRRDFPGAIQVLQDAIEGRVVNDQPAVKPPPTKPNDPSVPAPTKSEPAKIEEDPFVDEDDPGKAVFSADGRLYRPVLRLCHELVANMPTEGIELYRAKYEVEAERMLASAGRNEVALDALARRYFTTDAGARAVKLLADLLLDGGRFRAAAELLRSLRAQHPRLREGEGLADVTTLEVDLALAVCYQLGGEPTSAAAQLQEMQRLHPGASVRIEGELVPVSDLGQHALFAGSKVSEAPKVPTEETAASWTLADCAALVPQWRIAFNDAKPYAAPTAQNNRVAIFVGEGSGGVVPRASLGEPGLRAVVSGEELVFLEHNRLRRHELASGRVLAESDGAAQMYRIDSGAASPRIAVYDFATSLPAFDAERFYVVTVPTKKLPNAAPVLENRLVALDRKTMAPVWSLGHAAESEEFRAATFLASPTLFRDRLLVPMLVRGVYTLQCLDARTGAPLFRTALHSGGTDLVRAPGSHVVVDRDTAYVMTNAGVMAAIDAYSGVVRWLRRYERLHPLRKHPPQRIARGNQARFGQTLTTAASMPGFQFPSEVLLRDGRLIFAPTDGRCLVCLDQASGEIDWLIDLDLGVTDYMLGADQNKLYLAGKKLTCIDLRTGLLEWDIEVPSTTQGRGAVFGDLIVLPGDRQLHVLDKQTHATWQTRDLPRFLQGQDAMAMRANVQVHGAFLIVGYGGGVEVYASAPALLAMVEGCRDPRERVRLRMHAGDLAGAVEDAGAALEQPGLAAADKVALLAQIWPVVHEVAVSHAAVQQRDAALQLLDRARRWLDRGNDIEQWHLARIEVLRALGDATAAQTELETLRSYMMGDVKR